MALKVIEAHVGVFDANNRLASEIRQENKEKGVFLVNVMASPGAGKTTTLLKTNELLKDKYKIGVMEADIDASVDAETMIAHGIDSIQVHTGGECAMDATMTDMALKAIDRSIYDLLFLENVGNLVCPAEQDVGSNINIEILSVPEGDDKPLKYPLMFEVCQSVLINKIDTKQFFPFDDEAVKQRILARNPDAQIFFISAKTGEGMEAWTDWLSQQIEAAK